MSLVAGADGCPGGWVVAVVDTERSELTWHRAAGIGEVLRLLDRARVEVLGIDIPIGLPRPGESRRCDLLARSQLGPRRSCVFPAPSREVLAEPDFWRANAVSRRLTGKGLSKQAFHIGARIVDADRAVRTPLKTAVVEVHPELSFAVMAGAPIGTKKTAAGLERRAGLLEEWLPGVRDVVAARPPRVRADDALDAIAAAWSARRWLRGEALCLPTEPDLDEVGLPMRIVS